MENSGFGPGHSGHWSWQSMGRQLQLATAKVSAGRQPLSICSVLHRYYGTGLQNSRDHTTES